MNTTNTNRNIISVFGQALVLCLTMLFSQSKAQVIYTESFDGTAFIPLGWSPVNSGSNYWARTTAGNTPNTPPHSGAAMAGYNCITTGGGPGGGTPGAPAGLFQIISTPSFDLSGKTVNDTARVSLWIFRNGGAAGIYDSINIMVNTVQDTTGAVVLGTIARSRLIAIPDTFNVSAWRQYTFDIPGSFNSATNYLMIRAVSQAGNNIYIDDVSWTAFPPACTGMPTAGTTAVADTLICGGSGSTTLRLTGSSVASAITHQWQSSSSSNGPWTDFGTGQNTQATGTLTTPTYFRCYVTCTASGLSDSTNFVFVNVNPNPNPTLVVPTSPLTYCNGSGNPAVLTVSGANTYTWSPATGLNTTTGDTVLSSPAGGGGGGGGNQTVYTVIGKDTFGCTSSATVTVQVRPTPNTNVQTLDSVLCPGQTTTLTVTGGGGGGGGGNTYAWLPNGETTQQITAAPTATTMYYCTLTSGFGGCSKTDSLLVTVTNGLVANFGYTVVGHTVTFSDSSANATNWSWSFGDGNGSTNHNPVYTYSADGSYQVMLVVGNGVCNNDTLIVTININISGLPSNQFGSILSVVPNPVSDIAIVKFTSIDTKADFVLMTPEGKIVQQHTVTIGKGEQNLSLDMKSLATGIYIAQLHGTQFNATFRIVKK